MQNEHQHIQTYTKRLQHILQCLHKNQTTPTKKKHKKKTRKYDNRTSS